MLAKNLQGAAFIQEACVIVDVFREQARSYRGRRKISIADACNKAVTIEQTSWTDSTIGQ